MNLYDIIFKGWGDETIKAPVTRHHYVDGRPMRVELGGYEPPNPKARYTPEATARGKLLEVLRNNPGATAQKVASLTGRTVANASRHMYVLVSIGMVTSEIGPTPEHGGRPKFKYYLARGV